MALSNANKTEEKIANVTNESISNVNCCLSQSNDNSFKNKQNLVNNQTITDENFQQTIENDQSYIINKSKNLCIKNEQVEINNENLTNKEINETNILRTQQTLKIPSISKLKEMILKQKALKQSNNNFEIKEQLIFEQNNSTNTDIINNEIDQKKDEENLNLLLK